MRTHAQYMRDPVSGRIDMVVHADIKQWKDEGWVDVTEAEIAGIGCREDDDGDDIVNRLLRGLAKPVKFPPGLEEMGLTKDSTIEEFADNLMWGTYGRPASLLKYKRLHELDTEHLENILTTQRHIPQMYTRAILFILRKRAKAKPRLFARLWRLANSI